jgi:hypothetical protein
MKVLKNIRIAAGTVTTGGKEVFRTSERELVRVEKSIYRHLGIDYPKFYKMSPMSKLGFLAAEILLEGTGVADADPERVSMVFANASSSLHTDRIYQESIPGKPSPAIFVYTLPNIMIGEICIRHGFKSEGLFFIEEEFNKAFALEYAEDLIRTGRADFSLAGWVEVDQEGNYLADLDLLG